MPAVQSYMVTFFVLLLFPASSFLWPARYIEEQRNTTRCAETRRPQIKLYLSAWLVARLFRLWFNDDQLDWRRSKLSCAHIRRGTSSRTVPYWRLSTTHLETGSILACRCRILRTTSFGFKRLRYRAGEKQTILPVLSPRCQYLASGRLPDGTGVAG